MHGNESIWRSSKLHWNISLNNNNNKWTKKPDRLFQQSSQWDRVDSSDAWSFSHHMLCDAHSLSADCSSNVCYFTQQVYFLYKWTTLKEERGSGKVYVWKSLQSEAMSGVSRGKKWMIIQEFRGAEARRPTNVCERGNRLECQLTLLWRLNGFLHNLEK